MLVTREVRKRPVDKERHWLASLHDDRLAWVAFSYTVITVALLFVLFMIGVAYVAVVGYSGVGC